MKERKTLSGINVGDRVSVVVRQRVITWGIVRSIDGEDCHIAVEGDDTNVQNYGPENIRKANKGMSPGDKRATNAVFLNLQKDMSFQRTAGVSLMRRDSTLEEYKESAQRWLKDQTELSTQLIECADWQEVYEYFKSQREAE